MFPNTLFLAITIHMSNHNLSDKKIQSKEVLSSFLDSENGFGIDWSL